MFETHSQGSFSSTRGDRKAGSPVRKDEDDKGRPLNCLFFPCQAESSFRRTIFSMSGDKNLRGRGPCPGSDCQWGWGQNLGLLALQDRKLRWIFYFIYYHWACIKCMWERAGACKWACGVHMEVRGQPSGTSSPHSHWFPVIKLSLSSLYVKYVNPWSHLHHPLDDSVITPYFSLHISKQSQTLSYPHSIETGPFVGCFPTQLCLGVPLEPTEVHQVPLNVSTAATCNLREPTGLSTCTSHHWEGCQPLRKCLEVLNFWTSASPLPEPNDIAFADITL